MTSNRAFAQDSAPIAGDSDLTLIIVMSVLAACTLFAIFIALGCFVARRKDRKQLEALSAANAGTALDRTSAAESNTDSIYTAMPNKSASGEYGPVMTSNEYTSISPSAAVEGSTYSQTLDIGGAAGSLYTQMDMNADQDEYEYGQLELKN